MRSRDTWRCFWSWPPGHRFEVIPYFDGVAGRWRAVGRCACCDKLRGLAVGDPVSGPAFPNQPLVAGLYPAPQPAEAPSPGAPTRDGDFADVALGDGNRLFVRRAQVGTPLRRGRRVYVAYVIGSGRRRAVSPSLTRAVRRALHERPRSPRLTGVLAELEHELAS